MSDRRDRGSGRACGGAGGLRQAGDGLKSASAFRIAPQKLLPSPPQTSTAAWRLIPGCLRGIPARPLSSQTSRPWRRVRVAWLWVSTPPAPGLWLHWGCFCEAGREQAADGGPHSLKRAGLETRVGNLRLGF